MATKATKATGSSTWTSQDKEARTLQLFRPCFCGCDARGGLPGVGYLLGCNAKGEGVTIWIDTEDAYLRLEQVMAAQKGKR